MQIGVGDLMDVVYNWTRNVLLHTSVNYGATSTVIPLTAVQFTPNQWVGRWLLILGGPARYNWRRIISNTATSVTLESATTAVPNAGDEVAILEFGPVTGTVTADQGAPGAQPWPVDWQRIRSATAYRVLTRTALATGGSATIWTPGAGLRVRLLSLHVTTSAATVLTVRLGADAVWERDFGAAGGADVLLPLNGILGPVDGALTVTSSAAATVGATAVGLEE